MGLLVATEQALARNTAARRRAESGQRRTDTREWVVERRERTRHLIELGGIMDIKSVEREGEGRNLKASGN